jgi:hypothetical protein
MPPNGTMRAPSARVPRGVALASSLLGRSGMRQDDPGSAQAAGPPSDPAIADLVARYVMQCRSRVVRLLIHLGHYFERDDFPMAAALGRDLAGSGASFGLPRISAVGRDLARAAEAADGPAVMQGLHDLQEYLDTLPPSPPTDPTTPSAPDPEP